MLRKELLVEVEELLDTYCNGCFLKKQHTKDHGRRYAHRFCITKCTVGEKIQAYGDLLTINVGKNK